MSAHPQKWIVGIHRTQIANALHMIGATAHHHTGFKDGLVWLKPRHPFFAKVFAQSMSVQPQPRGLQVGDDAQSFHFVDGVFAHEVAVSNARAMPANRKVVIIDAAIRINQRLNGTVAHRVRRKLQVSLQTHASEFVQPMVFDVLHASIFRIINGIHAADTPRFLHQRAAGQHASIQKHLHTTQPDHVVVLVSRMFGSLIQRLPQFIQIILRIDAPAQEGTACQFVGSVQAFVKFQRAAADAALGLPCRRSLADGGERGAGHAAPARGGGRPGAERGRACGPWVRLGPPASGGDMARGGRSSSSGRAGDLHGGRHADSDRARFRPLVGPEGGQPGRHA